MNLLNNIQNIYFVGIGGIGMSALAFYFHNEGKIVAGYDKTPSAITTILKEVGIEVHFKDHGSVVDKRFKDKDRTLIVYTPAVPNSFGELVHFRESGYMLKKRAEVLGIIANESYSMAVAGTHGKTTTSSILGHLLAETGAPVTAFVGGIANNYKSNLIQKGNEVVVVEADEFDRSFLQLKPNLLCITSMDADHLDIYKNEEDLVTTFQAFGALVTPEHRFVQKGLPIEGNTIAVGEDADYAALKIRVENGVYVFDVAHPDGMIKNVHLSLPGRHNLFNAVSALAMALAYGIKPGQLAAALASYSGVNRRFTYRIKSDQRILIDDYAHHPTEIAAVHQSIRELYPSEKVLAVFQPHLFSRTQDFMVDFVRELACFDEVVLLDIYPARELPIDGVTSLALHLHINALKKRNSQPETSRVAQKNELTKIIRDTPHKIIVMMGAGDIGVEILKVAKNLIDES